GSRNVQALHPCRRSRCNSRLVGIPGTDTDASLAAAAGPLHHSVRSGRRSRYRRAAHSGPPASTLGQAGRHRESAGRKRSRAEPSKFNSAAVPGITELAFDYFAHGAKITTTKVPYKDIVQAVNDLAEDRLQVYSAS